MAKELGLQANIRKSADYGLKLSNRFTLGVPDLLLVIAPFVPCIVEVKDLGPVVDNFDRQLAVTPLQDETMRRINAPYHEVFNRQIFDCPRRLPSFLLVGLQHHGEHRLVVLPAHTERLSHLYQGVPLCWTKRLKGGIYALKPLFQFIKAPEIKLL